MLWFLSSPRQTTLAKVDYTSQNVVLLELGEKLRELEGAPHLAHVGGEGIELGEHAFFTRSSLPPMVARDSSEVL